jgi:hypothetical protein
MSGKTTNGGSLTERPAYALPALAFATIFLISIPVAAWVYLTQRPIVDFVSFWAAGRLVLSGHPALAYDLTAHHALEQTVTTIHGGVMGFPYPPPFLFPVTLVAIAPFWVAYLLWIGATTALFVWATRSLLPPRFALAHPAALVNSIIGQNGLLLSGIFIGGVSLVSSRPLLAGLVLGLLIVKPQLAVLIPVALLASRNWQAIGGAAISAVAVLALAAAAFGPDTYRAYFAITRQYAEYMATVRWTWEEQASVFAMLQFFGISRSISLAIQLVSAIAAAALTWRAWSLQLEQRGAILAAATILVPPYLYTYDTLVLVLPAAALLLDTERPSRLAILWLTLFLPLIPLFGFPNVFPGPNTIPIGAILCLWWLSRDSLGKKKAAAPFDAAAQTHN